MIKYTRSVQKLSDCIKDIFEAQNISIDTKAIVLVLAATMSVTKFNAFIDSIDKLSAISVKLKQVNYFRAQCGDLFRDFTVMQTLYSIPAEISSDELQQFIRDGKTVRQESELSHALPKDSLEVALDKASLGATIERAAAYLIAKFDLDTKNKITTITDAYLHCRDQEKPLTAYYAVMYAMADILELGGLDPKNSLIYSNKLAEHALSQFVHDVVDKNRMLHSYDAKSD